MTMLLFRYPIVFIVSIVFNLAVFLTPQQARPLATADVISEQMLAPWTGDLSEMREQNLIRVLVPYSRIILFFDKDQFRGASVDLLRAFEKKLNKGRKELDHTIVAIIPTYRKDLISDLAAGLGDIALGNLTITPERQALVDFSDPLIDKVSETIVTGTTHSEIDSIEDLSGIEIYVRPSSSYYASLKRINEELKAKKLAPVKIVDGDENLEDGDILEMVNSGMIKATIVDKHKLGLWTKIYKKLKVHPFAVRTGGQIAWAMRKNSPELAKEINEFVKTSRQGTLLGNTLFKRYVSNAKPMQNVNSRDAADHLKPIASLFQKYGKEYRINWRLIASQSFQESRFDHSRKSKAGAEGLMQIKPSTAADPNVGIKNIKSPEANVNAGVKYLRFLADRYFSDPEIDDFNRVLFALAAYNAGPIRIVRLRKKSATPNQWFGAIEWDVSKTIGSEPVRYVRNIYVYYLMFRNIPE